MSDNGALFLFSLLVVLTGSGVVVFFRRCRPHGKSTAASLVASNSLVLAFVCSLAVLAGEAYFRFGHNTTDSFALTKSTQRWFAEHFRYNGAGLRDSIEYSLKRSRGRRRISFLGDSFTVGHGIANVEDRFTNRIRAMLPATEIHVLAQPGLDTEAEIDLLSELIGSGYKLDDVVLVYCLNDISDIVPEWQQIVKRIYQRPRLGFLIDHSYLLNWLYYRIFAARDPDVSSYYGFVLENYEGAVWERQRRRLARLQYEVEKHGGRLLVVTFPFLHRLGLDYEYSSVHRNLDEFWTAQGVPHLDLLDMFGSMASEEVVVSRFDAHPNERAHAMSAGVIATFLKEHAPRTTR